MTKTTLHIPPELWYRLKLRALQQSTSATKLVEEAIRLLLRTKSDADASEPRRGKR
jgi:hypothetical protein